MTGALAVVVGVLGAMVVLLLLFIVVIRLILTRRQRQVRALRPLAEASIAAYVSGGDPASPGQTDRARAVFLEVMLDAISDVRGRERARLVALLEQLGYVNELIRGLGARRRVVRRRAADMLTTIATESAAPGLAAGLADPDMLVQTTCAAALAAVGGSRFVPAIIAAAERAAGVAPGAAASIVLGLAMHRPSVLAVLLAPDAAPAVRAVAVTVAGELRLSEHSERLRSCLASDDLAASAARGLGLIGEVEAVPALMALATGRGGAPGARAAATVALGRIGDASALSALDAQLRDQDWALRAAAAEALHRLGEQGDAALRRAAHSRPEQLGELAEAALQP